MRFCLNIPAFDEEKFCTASNGYPKESVLLAKDILVAEAELDRIPESERGEWYKRQLHQTLGLPQPSIQAMEDSDCIEEKYHLLIGWPSSAPVDF